jgi:hypothetical protein
MRLYRAGALGIVLALVAVIAWPRAASAQEPSNLRVIAPQNGPTINTDFIDIHYELINPTVSAESPPNFELQLDDNSTIQTNSTDYTFTGLPPGRHTVLIKLVDANGTPVPGSISTVGFMVAQQPAPKGTGRVVQSPAEPASASFQEPPTAEHKAPNTLVESNGALPLLSLIGFGVLVGGIVSALKTR